MTTIPGMKPSAPSPIQRTSLPSVSIFWLNLDQVRACLKKAVARLAEKHPETEEVWLFGSLARGDAVPGSDADVLVVLSESPLSFLDRSVHYQPDSCGVGVDVLAYTRTELAQMQTEGNSFIQCAQAEALCLFQRPGSPGKAP